MNLFRLVIAGLFVTFLFNHKVSAQAHVNQVVVVNGGVFEFTGPPFQDRATLGVYNPYTKKYATLDTIRVESVQDLVVDSGFAYVAAQDTIIKFDLLNNVRVGSIAFSGLQSLTIIGNHLIIGKWFGTGDFLFVYDKSSLALEFSIPQVNTSVHGAAIIGDTLYVPYNELGTIDNCPPFGCFDDSLGRIAVIDIPTQAHIYDIQLDTIGAEAREAYAFNSKLYVISEKNGILTQYDPATGALAMDTIGISNGIGVYGNTLHAKFNGNVGTYDLSTSGFINDSIFNPAVGKAAFDPINNLYYTLVTDFTSFGKTFIYSSTGLLLDSVDVEISPNGVAMDIRTGNAKPYAFPDTIRTLDMNDVVADVQANDIDPNGDTLTTFIFSNGAWGNANVLDGDSIRYLTFVLHADSVEDSLVYVICDDGLLCDTTKLYLKLDFTVGVEEIDADDLFNLYPNPASTSIYIETITNTDEAVQISVKDITGKNVLFTSYSGLQERKKIDLSGFNRGLYFITVEMEGKRSTYPITLQ